MRNLEEKVLERIGIQVLFYFRYVDDIGVTIPSSFHYDILDIFNSFHLRLQFTMERKVNSLNFLDVMIKIVDNIIEFDWFHKPTFSGRYLNFHSLHLLTQKRGIIIKMTNQAFLLSHPRYHKKNLELVINTLLNNDYPLNFIFDTINSRLKYLLRKRDFISEKKKKRDIMNASYNTLWFTIPYLLKFADKFKEVIRSLDTRLSFYSLNKLGGIIKTLIKISFQNYRIKMWCINYAVKIVTLLMLDRCRDN